MCKRTARPALRLAPLSMRDARAAAELFHETVHAVNARDYTSEQLDAWAPGGAGPAPRLAERLLRQGALGAWDGSALVGFGSLEGADLLDMLYVRRDYQGRGVARLLAGGSSARRGTAAHTRSEPSRPSRRVRFSSARATSCCARMSPSARACNLRTSSW